MSIENLPENALKNQDNKESLTEYELMVEKFGKEFDLEDGFKLRSRIPREDYEYFRDKHIDKRINEENLEYSSARNEELIQELKYDDVTGLESRKAFFKRFENDIKYFFDISPDTEVSNKEWTELLMGQASLRKSKMLHLLFGDVSFLSVANRGGRHLQGDKSLKDIAGAMKSEIIGAGRLSGDEFIAVLRASERQVDEKVERVNDKVEEIEPVPNLKKFGLDPSIDLGGASFSEALTLYRSFVRDGLDERGGARDSLRDVQEVWMMLADKRSSLKKAQTRLKLLIERKIDPDKEDLNELKKGAYNISENELESLIQKTGGGKKNVEVVIKEFIKDKEIRGLAEENSKYLYEQNQAILKMLEVI